MKRLLGAAAIVCVSAVILHAQSAVTVSIDVASARHPINPTIYGVAYADAAAISDLKVPLNRWGGNAATRYNWQVNASNRGADWYFESIPDGPATPGGAVDDFVIAAKNGRAEPAITVPMVGWLAKVGPTRNNLASFSIAKYGPQTGNDAQWFPDAGNGISASTRQPIASNDPNDANVPSNAAYERGWIQHLVARFGTSGNGGVRFYELDNEPSLWHSTHRDVHPNGATMDEVFNDTVAYAAVVKDVDAAAVVMGPEEWGWSGYLYSGADQQFGATHGWSSLPDRAAHGNMDFIPWYLAQMRQQETTGGRRLLDVLTVHYYPQGGQYSSDTSTTMQQLRNRSTRALWDPAYVDESWIGTPVQLIPRLQKWVATYYPGTKIGITEYNWGAETHINGATTLADILGIFGREGLDLATLWSIPPSSSPAYKAIKMYRNYDGQGGSFGDVSVSAVAPNPDSLSVFAAQRSGTNALTIMAVNKDLVAAPVVTFAVSHFTASGPVQVWQLTGNNAIVHLADLTIANGRFATSVPVQSITVFIIPAGGAAPSPPTNLRIIR